MKKEKISVSQSILILLAETNGKCLTLEELKEKTMKSEETLLVVLSKMKRKGLITSRWLFDKDGKRRRLYCLEAKIE